MSNEIIGTFRGESQLENGIDYPKMPSPAASMFQDARWIPTLTYFSINIVFKAGALPIMSCENVQILYIKHNNEIKIILTIEDCKVIFDFWVLLSNTVPAKNM